MALGYSKSKSSPFLPVPMLTPRHTAGDRVPLSLTISTLFRTLSLLLVTIFTKSTFFCANSLFGFCVGQIDEQVV